MPQLWSLVRILFFQAILLGSWCHHDSSAQASSIRRAPNPSTEFKQDERNLALTQDAVLFSGAVSFYFNLDMFSGSNQNATVQVFRFTSVDIPAGATVTCTFNCAQLNYDMWQAESIRFNSGGPPESWADYTALGPGRCKDAQGFEASFIPSSTAPLYVSVATGDPDGVVDGTVMCEIFIPTPSPTTLQPTPFPTPYPSALPTVQPPALETATKEAVACISSVVNFFSKTLGWA